MFFIILGITTINLDNLSAEKLKTGEIKLNDHINFKNLMMIKLLNINIFYNLIIVKFCTKLKVTEFKLKTKEI